MDSWISQLECADYKPLLTALFSKYIDFTLEHCRRNFKTVVPLPAINQVQTVCKVGGLDGQQWMQSCFRHDLFPATKVCGAAALAVTRTDRLLSSEHSSECADSGRHTAQRDATRRTTP